MLYSNEKIEQRKLYHAKKKKIINFNLHKKKGEIFLFVINFLTDY